MTICDTETPGAATGSDLGAKLDCMLGKVDAIMTLQTEHAARLDSLSDRVAKLEEGVTATKDVVDAWAAAKTGLHFIKWLVTFVAALAGFAAAVRGWLQR